MDTTTTITTTTTTTTTVPASCSSSSTGSRVRPAPDKIDPGYRGLSDAGRKRLSSFPSRQRRMGPAPLASFEDLSMDKTTSDSSSPEERTHLPEIGEETSGNTTPVTPVVTSVLTVPASPKIRVSAASSSSPHETDSKDSTPEKELFSGYAKSDFCENMAADLHSSTEELDADDEEQKRRRKERATKLAELDRREEALRVADFNRKGSSSSVISDGLLPITSAHSSRLSSLGSIGSARRSPSPHRIRLETSFCGSRPIQQPSIDLEDPPISTTKLMDFTIDSIERVKSPMEAKPPDIFRSSPSNFARIKQEELVVAAAAAAVTARAEMSQLPPPTAKKKSPGIKTEAANRASRSREQHITPTAINRAQREQKSTQPAKSPARDDHEKQRQPLSSQSSPRSPRMPKKVAVPQVPELKDLPKSSPSPSTASGATSEHHSSRSSTTPSASPTRASRRRRTRDELESGSSSPSVSRKSSFTNLFRKSESSALSPVTPDSPGSTGRRSPFSQFIRSAKKEFRSRSRSRSRSKSRERDLEDDTHDRRSVFSIFRPKTKKKSETEKGKAATDAKTTSTDSKVSEAITNVEFTFNDDGKYQSSTYGLIRQESEVNRAIKEPLAAAPTLPSEAEAPRSDTFASSRDSSYNELSSIMNAGEKHVSTTIAEEDKTTEKRGEIEDDEVFDKPSEPPKPTVVSQEPKPKTMEPTLPASNNIKENKIQAPKLEKPSLPPKQKDRLSDTEVTTETLMLDPNADADSRSESERESEIEYLNKKTIKQQGAAELPLDSPDVENKVLVSQDSLEDGELPYVPTSLPAERPLAMPMVPVRERTNVTKLHSMQSIDRPRSTTPLMLVRLEDYQQQHQQQQQQQLEPGTPDSDADRMMISIPQKGPVKVLPTRSPKHQSSKTGKTWEDFCSEGLRSPRTLRKQYKENKLRESEEDKPPPLPPKTRSPARSPVGPRDSAVSSEATTPSSLTPTAGEPVKSWINFDEMPDIVLKPVRHIKTVPTRHQAQQRQAMELRPHDQRNQPADTTQLEDEVVPRKLPPPLPKPLNLQGLDSDYSQAHSEVSTPEKAENSDRSSDSDKPTSPSSSEDLTTVRERLEEIKNEGNEFENSDLERLLAPVNDCINRLSSLSAEPPSMMERRSPIPDNWADFLLPPQPGRRSRLSSLGSDAGSVGRSPSPSCMFVETSFCGSQPIDDPAVAEPDVPIAVARKLSGISLGDLSPFGGSGRRDSSNLLTCPDRTSILSDSSAEGGASPREVDYYGGTSRQQQQQQQQQQYQHYQQHQQQQEGSRGQQGVHQLNPFDMDLGVRSNRSSVVSQDQRQFRGAP